VSEQRRLYARAGDPGYALRVAAEHVRHCMLCGALVLARLVAD
jgi:hypothetical protein